MTDLKYLTFFGAEVVSGDGGEEGGNGDDPIIAQVMGWTSFAAYIPLLLPQILLHYRSQTTFGFSKFAVVCWHLGSLMYIAYTVYDAQPMHIMVIWLWYTTCSMVIVGQWMYYDADWISNRARGETIYGFLRWSMSFMCEGERHLQIFVGGVKKQNRTVGGCGLSDRAPLHIHFRPSLLLRHSESGLDRCALRRERSRYLAPRGALRVRRRAWSRLDTPG